MSERNSGRRVAITGTGVVSALGTGVEKFWDAIKAGENGIAPLAGFPLQDLYITIGGEVKNFDARELCKSRGAQLSDRFTQYAAAAAWEAVRQSGLEGPLGERAACIVGSGGGGLTTQEKAYEDIFVHKKKATHPLTLLKTISSSSPAHISIEHGITGPVFGTVSACSTAAHAIGLAFQMIRSGLVNVAVAGASEASLNYGCMRAWQAMRVLSPEGCFPFSSRRNGTVIAEGAGILLLEDLEHARARGAAVLGEVLGFGMTSDAADMVNPDIEGPTRAMQIALDDARLSPGDIDYLNAHGTATAANDINETRAIRKVFGAHADSLAVSSTKSMHGHCLGAGGGLEAVVCVQAMRDGFIPATIGLDEPGEGCDLDYVPHEGRYRALGYTMSNSFAFGGLNAVLVFGPATN
ncbi:beta-ketoacyl-[acyl-carrier-protein] synthase family protein [Rhodomicrobium sp.]|uniref:beta-ketoacyl-[acyl-carrier-protein] synthase family protein n=1 Tax=Rhodomicrobium sp. TaxID=2720632 RepID=UPI0039E60308